MMMMTRGIIIQRNMPSYCLSHQLAAVTYDGGPEEGAPMYLWFQNGGKRPVAQGELLIANSRRARSWDLETVRHEFAENVFCIHQNEEVISVAD